MTVFKTARRRAVTVGGGDGCEEPTSQFHTCLEGKTIKEIGGFLEWVGGDHQDGSCGFSVRGFDTRGYFLF